MDYKKWTIDWFANMTGKAYSEVESQMEKNYFDLGYIDSFQFIQLISDIEELGITLVNEQFEDRRFATIKGLIEILDKCGKECDV